MKNIIKIFMFCITLSLMITLVNINASDTITATCGEATYKTTTLEESLVVEKGVNYNKYSALSSINLTGFSAAGSGGGGLVEPGKFYPQQVNILELTNDSMCRVVNWSRITPYGWSRGTVKDMAKDFEKHNPGWVVVGAVNGDFFDISSKHALPETTTGSCISDGVIMKATGGTVIGFTKENGKNVLIGDVAITFTDEYYLSCFDEKGSKVEEYKVDHVNPVDLKDGLSIYFSVPKIVSGEGATAVREYSKATIPSNGFISSNIKQCIPYSSSSFLGIGEIELVSENKEITKNQFGVYTTNIEVSNSLNNAAYIQIQKKTTGDYENVLNVTGTGNTLVKDGSPIVSNDKNRHPRTMIGIKEDGTYMFVTVDGRQPNDEMYGMTLDELSALMYAHGCVAAYNMDGGGSTTMLVRKNGKLEVVNSPSDGNERRDSNAILIVKPELSLEVKEVNTNSIKLAKPSNAINLDISNILVKINDKVVSNEFIDNTITIDKLDSNKEYTIIYTYDLNYNGDIIKCESNPLVIKTGKIVPTFNNMKYSIDNNQLIVKYEINDPDDIITILQLTYDGKKAKLDKSKQQLVIDGVSSVNTINILAVYNIDTLTSAPIYSNIPLEEEIIAKKSGCNFGAYVASFIATFALATIIIKRK